MSFDRIKKLLFTILKHKTTQNFIIIALISLLQILSNVVLGRYLSKNDFGKFSFIINNIIRVWSVLFIFGQTSSILRLFSTRNIQEFKWKKTLVIFLLIILLPIIVATYLVALFYQLSGIMFAIAVSGSFLTCCIMMLASIYRSQGKFNTAVLVERSHAIIFVLLLFYPYLILKNFDLVTVSLLKLISFAVIIPLLLFVLVKWEEGPQKIKKESFYEGLSLWELSLSVLVLTNIDSFFIVKILDYKELALYSIIGSIMIVYEFAREAVFSVYTKKYAERKNQDSNKIFKIVVLVSIFLFFFYLISTNFILQLLFNGKYHSSILLLVLFCIYSTLNLLYVIPSCYFVGQGARIQLRIMMVINIISIVLKISMIFIFSKFGLQGFVFASIIAQGFRVAGGYYIAFIRKDLIG